MKLLRSRVYKFLKKLHLDMLNDYESTTHLKAKSGLQDIMDYHAFIRLN
jgi:hypothetical protein